MYLDMLIFGGSIEVVLDNEQSLLSVKFVARVKRISEKRN